MSNYRKHLADDRTLGFVREYLQKELPDYLISEKCDSDPQTLTFKVSDSSHSIVVSLQKCFVNDESTDHVVHMLNKINIAYVFEQHPDIDAFVISCTPDRL